MFLKYDELAASMTLWALTVPPSTDMVISTRSEVSYKLLNPEDKFFK